MDNAVKSGNGESSEIPAATKAARLTKCEAGEYAGPVSAERRVFLQKVLGLTDVLHSYIQSKSSRVHIYSHRGGSGSKKSQSSSPPPVLYFFVG